MLLFWGIFLGIGIVLFLLWLVILRRAEAAGVLSALSLLVCMNFGLVKTGVQRLLPLVSGRWILGPAAAAPWGTGVPAEVEVPCSADLADLHVWRALRCQRHCGTAKAG